MKDVDSNLDDLTRSLAMVEGLRFQFSKQELSDQFDILIGNCTDSMNREQEEINQIESQDMKAYDKKAAKWEKMISIDILRTLVNKFETFKSHLIDEDYSLSIDDMREIGIITGK